MTFIKPNILVNMTAIVISFHKIVQLKQERPAVADKPARHLRNVCTVYVRAVGL